MLWRPAMPAVCPEQFDAPCIFGGAHSIGTGSYLPRQDSRITSWSVLRNFTVETIVWTYGYTFQKYRLKFQWKVKWKDLKHQAFKWMAFFKCVFFFLQWSHSIRADLIWAKKKMRLFSWLLNVLLLIVFNIWHFSHLRKLSYPVYKARCMLIHIFKNKGRERENTMPKG